MEVCRRYPQHPGHDHLAQALRLLLDLALSPEHPVYFGTARRLDRAAVRGRHEPGVPVELPADRPRAGRAGRDPGLTIYGPRDAARRTSLVAFNLAGRDPVSVAGELNQAGVESRAGCHCATLAHHALGLTPPASCG